MPYGCFIKCDKPVNLIYLRLYSFTVSFSSLLGNPWNFSFWMAVLFLLVKTNNQITTIKIHSAFSIV